MPACRPSPPPSTCPALPDESEAAARLAAAAGARHEVLRIDEAMVWRHLPDIVAAIDDPVADYAIIPTWLLARRARRDVKVILSGEGGDELFGGYGRYRKAMRPWWRGGRPMRSRGAFDGLDVLRAAGRGWRSGIAATELSGLGGRTRLAAAQASDIAEWLPNDLLVKLDRCLMAHGIEGRTPLLDPGVAAASFRLPDGLKVRAGMGKWLLRRWLETQMPEARPFAPKQGFTVPVGAWIAGAGRPAGAARRRPGGGRRDRARRTGSRRCSATPPAGGSSMRRGRCCSMRCGIGRISRGGYRRGMCSRRWRRRGLVCKQYHVAMIGVKRSWRDWPEAERSLRGQQVLFHLS